MVPIQKTTHYTAQNAKDVRDKFKQYFNNAGKVSFQERMVTNSFQRCRILYNHVATTAWKSLQIVCQPSTTPYMSRHVRRSYNRSTS